MVAAVARCRLHVDDRQPAVRLDALRQPDPRQARLECPGDPVRLLGLRRHRDVAGSLRGLSRRQDRTEARRRRGRHPRRAGVGHQLVRRFAADALPRRGRRRHRRGSGVRCVRGERAQVVPGSARTRLRSHRDGIRRRFGADGLPDRQHDQVAGLRGDLLQVRHRTGRRRLSGELVSARPRLRAPRRRCPLRRTRESSASPLASTRRSKRFAPRCSGCST